MNESAKTILIVDDEIFIRQSFVDYFKDRQWKIIEADRALKIGIKKYIQKPIAGRELTVHIRELLDTKLINH